MKKLRGFKIVLNIIVGIACFFIVINLIPPSKVTEDNPFVSTTGKPMLCAHRGGATNNPENTLKAYIESVNTYKADVLETDLWMTKDGYLVLSHDGTLDRTTDISLYSSIEKNPIEDYTLDEIKRLNFGYQFVSEDGTSPYKYLSDITDINEKKDALYANNLQIITIDDYFNHFYVSNPDLLFIVEIKNPGEVGMKAADILNDLLTNKYPQYKNRVVIGTFHDEIENYLKTTYPTLFRGASTKVATNFIITQLCGVNIFDADMFQCLQIPVTQKGLDLTLDTYIARAHKRNIAVQYWTINSEDEMRTLIDKKVDCIMTDNPKLLRNILEEI